MLTRFSPSLRTAAFVYLTATAVVMASERMYWYWAGFTPDSVLLLGGFYLIPTLIALWALGRLRAGRGHELLLGGAVFAFAVEGILTPVIYEDGVLPVLAALFVGWHGLLAFVGVWYLAHRWLVAGRIRLLAAAAAMTGAFWGAWAYVAGTLDPPTGEALVEAVVQAPLRPAGFAVYAAGVGATLVAVHWLLGFVWPRDFSPSKSSTWVIAVVGAAYFSVAALVVVPWAPLKLGVLLGGALWLLSRSCSDRGLERRPSLMALAYGKVRLRDASVLMVMPAVAAAVYAGLWAAGLGEEVSDVVFTSLNLLQVVAGIGAFGWAAKRALGRPSNAVAPPEARQAVLVDRGDGD